MNWGCLGIFVCVDALRHCVCCDGVCHGCLLAFEASSVILVGLLAMGRKFVQRNLGGSSIS